MVMSAHIPIWGPEASGTVRGPLGNSLSSSPRLLNIPLTIVAGFRENVSGSSSALLLIGHKKPVFHLFFGLVLSL